MHKRFIIIIAGNGFDPLTSGLWAQHASTAPPCSLLLGISQLYMFFKSRKSGSNNISLKLIQQFCITYFYCAHLITYNFIHYTYRLKKYHFMRILCYFKTSLVTFVQRITLKSMFSRQAYKSVAIGFPLSVVYLFTCISRFNATIP